MLLSCPRRLAGICGCIFFLISCGYRFAGDPSLPSGDAPVHVPLFSSRSVEAAVGNLFANDLSAELRRNGVTVRSGPDAAVFSGRIDFIKSDTAAREGLLSSVERRITVTLSVTLSDPDGNHLWKAEKLEESDTYTVMTEKAATDANKIEALGRISRRFAERIFDMAEQTGVAMRMQGFGAKKREGGGDDKGWDDRASGPKRP
ncbi:MAG: hypothetical protein CSB33_02020 [Desulfobacterales bacterium]|nr:MAG: hypothetical protein CSB33_02020 [Desulfobacterales bacterium]